MLKNTVIYIIANGIAKGLPFLMLPLLTRYIEPQEFGKLAFFNATQNFLSPFINLQLSSYITLNFFANSKIFISKTINLIILVTALMTILLTILLLCLKVVGFDILDFPLWLYCVLPVTLFNLTMINQCFGVQRNEERALDFLIMQLVFVVLEVSFTIFFVMVLKQSWQGRVAAILIAGTIVSLLSIWYLHKQKYIEWSLLLDLLLLKDALKYCIPLIPTTFAITAINLSDRYFIKNMVGDEALGIYSIGYSMGMIMHFFTISFEMAFIPWIYKLLSNTERLNENKLHLVRFTYIYILLMLIAVVSIKLLCHILLYFDFLPHKYQQAEVYVFWVALGYGLWSVVSIVGPYIAISKKSSYILRVTFIGVIVNTLLNYYLILSFGTIGAAYSTLITFLIILIGVWYYAQKVCPMPWLDSRLLSFSLKELQQMFDVQKIS